MVNLQSLGIAFLCASIAANVIQYKSTEGLIEEYAQNKMQLSKLQATIEDNKIKMSSYLHTISILEKEKTDRQERLVKDLGRVSKIAVEHPKLYEKLANDKIQETLEELRGITR